MVLRWYPCLVVSVALWKPGWKLHHFVVNPGDIKGSQGEDEGDREWKERMGRSWAQNETNTKIKVGHSFHSRSCLSGAIGPWLRQTDADEEVVLCWSENGGWFGLFVWLVWFGLVGLVWFVCLFVFAEMGPKLGGKTLSASLHELHHSKTSFEPRQFKVLSELRASRKGLHPHECFEKVVSRLFTFPVNSDWTKLRWMLVWKAYTVHHFSTFATFASPYWALLTASVQIFMTFMTFIIFKLIEIWVFPKIGVGPQNGWFIMENPIFYGWFRGTIIFGNTHIRDQQINNHPESPLAFKFVLIKVVLLLRSIPSNPQWRFSRRFWMFLSCEDPSNTFHIPLGFAFLYVKKTCEQWRKPWLFRVYIGDYTTQLYSFFFVAQVGFAIPVGVCGVNGMECGAGKYDWPPRCPFFFTQPLKEIQIWNLFGTESNLKMLLMILIHEYSWVQRCYFMCLLFHNVFRPNSHVFVVNKKFDSPANRCWIGNPSRCWSVDMLASLTKLDVRVGCRIVISCYQI